MLLSNDGSGEPAKMRKLDRVMVVRMSTVKVWMCMKTQAGYVRMGAQRICCTYAISTRPNYLNLYMPQQGGYQPPKDIPINIHTISIGLNILYFKRSHVVIFY